MQLVIFVCNRNVGREPELSLHPAVALEGRGGGRLGGEDVVEVRPRHFRNAFIFPR